MFFVGVISDKMTTLGVIFIIHKPTMNYGPKLPNLFSGGITIQTIL